MTQPVSIALIGCGAIAQRAYLPALAGVAEIRCVWLVDINRRLAENLARRFGIVKATDDYLSTLEEVEAVILTVPNDLHAQMTLEALKRGKMVLCEKPLGRTAAEVQEMATASESTGVPLMAGMIFRQYPGLQQIQAAFPWDLLGKIREIRASYGCPLDWPVSAVSFFDREMAGGGVLLDLGVHVIDSLLWVLSLEGVSVTDYRDNGESGVESEAKAYLTLRVPKKREAVPCFLEVSRLRRIKNRIEVHGENASLVIPLSRNDIPHLHVNTDSRPAVPHPVALRSETDCFREQIKAFARKVRGRGTRCATAETQVRVHQVIDSCYGVRKPLAFSWHDYEPWN